MRFAIIVCSLLTLAACVTNDYASIGPDGVDGQRAGWANRKFPNPDRAKGYALGD